MRPSTERAGFAAGLLALAAFAGARAPAGIYVLRLAAGGRTHVAKTVLVR